MQSKANSKRHAENVQRSFLFLSDLSRLCTRPEAAVSAVACSEGRCTHGTLRFFLWQKKQKKWKEKREEKEKKKTKEKTKKKKTKAEEMEDEKEKEEEQKEEDEEEEHR